MALYTKLSKSQITKLARSFGLGPPLDVKGVLEGTVNTYYRLHYPEKTYYLKIDEVADANRLRREIVILNFLQKKSSALAFLTPHPLPSLNGQMFIPFGRKFVLLFEAIPGCWIPTQKLASSHLKKIGGALASLHRTSKSHKFSPHRFDLQGQMLVYQQIQKKLRTKHPLVDLEVQKYLQFFRQQKMQGLPKGLIHADLFPENIHWQAAKLVGLLDFEAAGFGPLLFDVAVTLHACCHRNGRFSIPLAKAFLAGYERDRPLTQNERQNMGAMLCLAALRFLLTRLRDFELKEGPVMAKPFKDYREYVKRFEEIAQLTQKIIT